MTHTPGPWKLFAKGKITEVQSSGSTPIVSWLGFDDSDRSLKEHRANAHLIAAAPDLLEACKEAHRELMDWFLNTRPGEGPSETLMAKLEKAIAKAEGGTNDPQN